MGRREPEAARRARRARGPHEFRETPGEHSWKYWLETLPGVIAWHAERAKASAPLPGDLP